MAQAIWLEGLMGRVAALLGRGVTGIKCLEREEGGVSVTGTTVTDAGMPFEFTICGPFDVEVANPSAPPAPGEEILHPFGTEFGPAQPVQGELGSGAAAWEWGAAQVPLLAQPRLAGHTAILEKKGGKAKLWHRGERGVDQLAKFPALKEYVIKLAPDFVAEVTTGVERDGALLPDSEVLLGGRAPQLAEGDLYVVYLQDFLHFEGQDLTQADAATRYAALQTFHRESLAADPSFRLVPQQEARDQSELGNTLAWARSFPGSVGAVYKAAGARYPLQMADEARTWLGKEDAPPARDVPIYKAASSGEQRIVYGVVLRPDRLDAQDDIMSAVDVEKAAHHWMEHAQVMKNRHGRSVEHGDNPVAAAVLESYIAPIDFRLGSGEVKKGDWVIGVRVDDQGVWDKIQSGEYRAFSVGGVGTRQEV